MKSSLIKKILIVVAILVVGIVCYFAFFSQTDYNKEYTLAIANKYQKLEKTESPKVVIIGDENAGYGIDSKQLERALGIPVVNMALNSSIGTKNIIEYVKPHLEKGDILILSRKPDIVSEEGWKGVSEEKMRAINTTYTEEMFDKDNMNEEYLTGTYEAPAEKITVSYTQHEDKVKALENYRENFSKKGIKFYITPSAALDETYDSTQIITFWTSLSRDTGIPLLNSDNAYLYKRKYFKDSPHHLNKEGRSLRTASLAEEIRNSEPGLNSVYYVFPPVTNNVEKRVGISSFNDKNGFEILNREPNALSITPKSEPNYFRIKHKGLDYTGYTFAITIQGREDITKYIEFIGTSFMPFDHIEKKEDDIYIFYKERMKNVYFSDESSYFGITLKNAGAFQGETFKILKVELEQISPRYHAMENTVNKLPIETGEVVTFEAYNFHKKFRLNEIIENYSGSDILLDVKKLYKLEKTGTDMLFIRDFYTEETVFQEKYSDDIIFKGVKDLLLTVFKK